MDRNRRLLLGTAGALTLSACSTQQALNIALSRNPETALKSMAERRVTSYTYNPQLALADLRKIKTEYGRLMGNLEKESGEKWDKREAGTLPSRTRYVKYTENYKNRVVVDYDAGTILIEHLDDDAARDKLRRATVVALLTPGDPGAVDLFSDKEITLNLGLEPFFDAGKLEAKTPVMPIIVSDSGAPLGDRFSGNPLSLFRLKRIADIMGEQSRALRVRTYATFLQAAPARGAYIQINARRDGKTTGLGEYSAAFPTTLRCLKTAEFDKLAEHGYEVATEVHRRFGLVTLDRPTGILE